MSVIEICFCPDNVHQSISETLNFLGKKWTFRIIEELVFGYKHFKDFLELNPNLSDKVLAERLKELEKRGIIEKKVMGSSPTQTEYHLTEKGVRLTIVLFEVIKFAMETPPISDENKEYNKLLKKAIKIL